MYNDWFMNFAPSAFRETRIQTTKEVQSTLKSTQNLTNIRPDILRKFPEILPTLRMSTCPPLAVDRLIGLTGVPSSMVKRMEKEKQLPVRMAAAAIDRELIKIAAVIKRLADPDIFVWMKRSDPATEAEIYRAATIVADRLCGSVANPTIRNAQERRQLACIGQWLDAHGYIKLPDRAAVSFDTMPSGTYGFRMNVPVTRGEGRSRSVNIPVDVAIMRKTAAKGDYPLFVEAKSAGDFTNTNKRRKEEAQKVNQLRATYSHIRPVEFILFLCGYFDSGYLGYEAAEGIDWVWEHRIDDLQEFGL